MEQKEYPVGSRFQVNGQWYEVKPCVGDIVCTDCSFNSKNTKICECEKPATFQECVAPFRKDNTNVYFVKIDPPTDFLDASPLTRPIGSTFYDHGIKLKVCDAVSIDLSPCYKVCHYHNERCGNSMHIHGFCGNITRLDHKDVYFREVTDEKQ